MISYRYATAVIILVGIALVPTIIHIYIEVSSSDGLVTTAISGSLADLYSEPTSLRDEWVKKTFDSVDWLERRYTKQGDIPLSLFAARSYDHKRLYHHPELALVHGVDLQNVGAVRLANMPERPVHVLKSGLMDGRDLVVYSLLYRGRFVDNPYLFQFKDAWRSLFRSRTPMTLFFVHDPASLPDVPLEETRAVRLLIEAMDSFISQTPISVP